ncbi:MAG: hypothetical protein U5K43_13195 [Halofilum sp. (in: g-proteobacteria)]|nr:hypothetical protein [Halofilum sp. (in: g-proteobacteria)]
MAASGFDHPVPVPHVRRQQRILIQSFTGMPGREPPRSVIGARGCGT